MLSTKLKIKIASILSQLVRFGYRVAGIKSDIVKVNRKGFNWQLDLKEGIDFAVFLGIYEYSTIQLYKTFVKPGDTVLDIGANIGSHTLPLAKQVGDSGKVFAFEPTAFAFAKLSENIKLNPNLSTAIMPEQMLLTDNDTNQAEAMIYSSWPLEKTEGVHAKHLGNPKSTEGCRVMTLDSYVKTKNIPKVNFIKLDVDGFECDVLKGGLNLLKTHKPIIFMELAPYVLQDRGQSLEKLLALIKQAGYRFYQLGTDKALSMDPDFLNTLIPPGSSLNVMATAL